MSYAATRDSEQLRILNIEIGKFVGRYKARPPVAGRRTLFLFPGGMGSRLRRAKKRYDDNVGGIQRFDYATIWLDCGTLAGDALKLKMRKDAQGVHRDHNNRIIIAWGSVEFLGINPYDGFTDWCDDNNIDWFIYGYDWRRSMDETANFFLQTFLPHFRQQVQNACGVDPLQDFVLVGHSFGGMVVKLIVNSADALLGGMTSAITVGAPFYGYGGQMHRWCDGDSLFNHLGPKEVIRVISSMPGCYALCYLDNQTFATHQAALAADPHFPLAGYPSVDAQNAGTIADPYSPLPDRYPGDLGFDDIQLQDGLRIYREIAKPLPPGQMADNFFSIRGVQGGNKKTAGGVKWGFAPSPYDPTADSPLRYVSSRRVPGDGVQPAWTTRLVTQPANQCIAVTGDIEHMEMMESPDVQSAIADILNRNGPQIMMMRKSRKAPPARPPAVKPASSDEAIVFVQNLHQRSRSGGAAAVTKYVDSLPLGKLKSLARRIMMDIMKGPVPGSRATDKKRRRRRAAAGAAPGKKDRPATAGTKAKATVKAKARTRKPAVTGSRGRAAKG